MARDDKPPVELTVNVDSTSGHSYQIHPDDPDPRNRPQALNFRTKLGEGHSDGGGTLNRSVVEDWPDLELMSTWTFVDHDGDTAYQGYLAGQPRDLDDRHSIGLTLVGPVADLKRRQFRMVYVDRDPGRWGDMPLNEKARLALSSIDFQSLSWSSTGAALIAAFPNQALGTQVQAGTWYVAPPGTTVAGVQYSGSDTSLPAGWSAPRFVWHVSDFEDGSSEIEAATLDGNLQGVAPGTPRRFVSTDVGSSGTAATPAAGGNRSIGKVAVYGDHGLTLYAPSSTGEPDGVKATDAFRHVINTQVAGFDASGIGSSDYVIPHLVFADPTYPYDALLQINKYLQWKLAVWEQGRVVFEPHDLTDYTWQIRIDDPGVTVNWQGPSTETIFNGACVTYVDLLTGREEELTPDDRDDLRDANPENPFNKAGLDQWLPVPISTPQLEDGAAAIGAAALAEANRPKAPGIFTVRGHVRDRAGNWQPAHKVRAGDTVAFVNHPNDSPRLATETSYEQDTATLRVSVDSPPNILEAFFDRLDVELQAVGVR